jgi:hypothetical protein
MAGLKAAAPSRVRLSFPSFASMKPSLSHFWVDPSPPQNYLLAVLAVGPGGIFLEMKPLTKPPRASSASLPSARTAFPSGQDQRRSTASGPSVLGHDDFRANFRIALFAKDGLVLF